VRLNEAGQEKLQYFLSEMVNVTADDGTTAPVERSAALYSFSLMHRKRYDASGKRLESPVRFPHQENLTDLCDNLYALAFRGEVLGLREDSILNSGEIMAQCEAFVATMDDKHRQSMIELIDDYQKCLEWIMKENQQTVGIRK